MKNGDIDGMCKRNLIFKLDDNVILRTGHVCAVHDACDAGEQHSKHGGERHILLRRVVVRVVSCK